MATVFKLTQGGGDLVDLTDTTKYRLTQWAEDKLNVHVVGSSATALLDNLSALRRALQIARENDAARRSGISYTPVFLQFQLHGASSAVYSEVLGGMDETPRNVFESVIRSNVIRNIPLVLARRPYFEEAGQQSLASGTTGNDGAGITLSAARGDLPAPLYVKCRTSIANQGRIIAGVKWRGTLANFVSTYEAESATAGTNVALFAAGATFSGSGNNGMRWTPSGATSGQALLTWTNTTNIADQMGLYAVYVRCRDNNASGAKVRLRVRAGMWDGTNAVYADYADNPKYCLTANATIELVYCGTIVIPSIDTGNQTPNGFRIQLWGACDASPSTFDIDRLMLIPAQGAANQGGACAATMTRNAGTGALPDFVIDANDRMPRAYLETTAGAVLSGARDVMGAPLSVPPNQAAKLFVLTQNSSTGAHDFTATNTLTVTGMPRYRYGRGT